MKAEHTDGTAVSDDQGEVYSEPMTCVSRVRRPAVPGQAVTVQHFPLTQ